ncbi:helix-turn-helix transcriptional regulator [Gemella cuniculi]|uniref:helix-turn-helix transcriptional regulator n=1 Tax=Gemella cuniculi TaxID=150240 RepID=UPI0003FC6E18|nr:PAS domain-containing protein [Gemella cuniculi]
MENYIPIVDFISEIVGNKCEVVLHDLRGDLNKTIIYIKNSLSGRKVGSPATDLLVDILNKEIYKEKSYLTNYKSKGDGGKKFKSSSFFIKNDENELIGMICVNIDYSEEMLMFDKLEEFLEQFSKVNDKEFYNKEANEEIENLYGTMDNIVEDTIYKVTGYYNIKDKKLKKDDRLKIVSILNERGFFAVKESISQIANIFNMSEVSIYKYIQEIKKGD